MKEFDVYISYAKEDSDWINELVEEVESRGLKACWDSRDFDDKLSSHENRSRFVERCSCCLLVFSKVYCKRASEWSFFIKYLKSCNEDEVTVESVLTNKSVVCVCLSHCNIPSSFAKHKMLMWDDFEYSDLFWKKLLKRLKSAKKKNDVRQALLINTNISDAIVNETGSKREKEINLEKKAINANSITCNESLVDKELNNNNPRQIPSKADHNKIAHKTKSMYREDNRAEGNKHFTSHKQNTNKNLTTEDLESYKRNVYTTNKITVDFTPEEIQDDLPHNNDDDDDITKPVLDGEKKNVEKTTPYEMFDVVYPHLITDSFCAEDEDLTKEDVDKLTLKMEEVETIMYLNEKQKTPNGHITTAREIETNKKTDFQSQHEQMQLLDILQSLHESTQNKLDKTVATNSEHHALHKRRYRRLLRRYQDCIMKVVNGKKDVSLIESLPLVIQYLDDVEIPGCKCYCCGNLYHSLRALQIHLDVCVKQTWIELLRKNESGKTWTELFRKRK